MTMRYFFTLMTVALLLQGCMDKPDGKSVLTGTVDEYDGTGYLLLYNPSAGKGNSSYDTLAVGKNGEFRIELDLQESALRGLYLEYLGDRRNVIYCYMKPGGQLTVRMDGRLAESIEGDGAIESRYINRPEFFGYQYQQPDGTAMPYREFDAAVRRQQDTLRMMLVGAEADFAAAKEQDIEVMNDNMLFVYNRRLGRLGLRAWDDADFRRALYSIDLNDQDNLHRGLMSINTVEAINCRLANMPQLYAGEPSNARFFCFVRDSISDPYVRVALPSHVMSQMINPRKPQNLDRAFEVYHTIVGDTSVYHDIHKRYLDNSSQLLPGQPAPDFEMYDVKGNKVMFSAVIGGGKVTYVDFWATWCGPCVAEIPHLERLVEELKDNNKIRFVSVSLDENVDKWKQSLETDKPSWAQYNIPEAFRSTFAQRYKVNGIPQFMLFDGEGRIIDLNAPRPSNNKIREILTGK